MAQEKTGATTLEEPVSKTAVDEAIAGIERLYETLTGTPAPEGGPTYAPIPVERNPSDFVEERLERLLGALGQPFVTVAWTPPMVVWEDTRATVACLDLPGVKRSEIEVTDEGGVVTVTGQRAAAYGSHRLQLAERPLGAFRRQILLPRGAQVVNAKLQEGVLELHIAKEAPGAAAKKIEVT
jgi:HSP20 family protein